MRAPTWGCPYRSVLNMTFNPDIHHRRSIRLRDYDYSRTGAYFVTICTSNRECLFGNIHDNKIDLNDAGRMIEEWWEKLPDKFPTIDKDASVIMPNHFHGIVAIVGAAPCGRPTSGRTSPVSNQIPQGHPQGGPTALGNILDWFKTMTTNAYIRGVEQYRWQPFPGKLWQRNYYEHIIRDENDLNSIREYIITNPARWADDEEKPDKQ
jgi:putative transposase